MFEAKEAGRGRETGLAGAAGWRLAKQQSRLAYSVHLGDSVGACTDQEDSGTGAEIWVVGRSCVYRCQRSSRL